MSIDLGASPLPTHIHTHQLNTGGTHKMRWNILYKCWIIFDFIILQWLAKIPQVNLWHYVAGSYSFHLFHSLWRYLPNDLVPYFHLHSLLHYHQRCNLDVKKTSLLLNSNEENNLQKEKVITNRIMTLWNK